MKTDTKLATKSKKSKHKMKQKKSTKLEDYCLINL